MIFIALLILWIFIGIFAVTVLSPAYIYFTIAARLRPKYKQDELERTTLWTTIKDGCKDMGLEGILIYGLLGVITLVWVLMITPGAVKRAVKDAERQLDGNDYFR